MAGLSFEMTSSDLRAVVAVLPALLRKWRAAEFGPDSADLRLVHGVHGRAGARYQVPDPKGGEPAQISVTDDSATLLEATYTATGVDAVLRLRDPSLPGELHLGVRGQERELAVLGRDYTATASLYPAAIDRGGELGRLDVRFKRVRLSAHATASIRRGLVRVAIRTRVRARGAFLPAAPAMPLLRRKVERETQPELTRAAAELSALIARGELEQAAWREVFGSTGDGGRSPA